MDALVLQYLNSRGFTEAASQLQKEMNAVPDIATHASVSVSRMGVIDPDYDSDDERSRLARLDARKSAQQKAITSLVAQNTLSSEDLVMFSFVGEDNHVEMYDDSYDRYRSWALGSLDLVKVELLSLCFPIFVTSYLSMVRRGAVDAARLYWEHWQRDFADLYAAEMVKLSIITVKEQLEDPHLQTQSHFVRCCMQNKFKCVISHLAFGLLATFLAQQELLLAAAIINDRVQFVRVEQVPKLSDAQSGLLLELIAYTNVATVTRDRLPALLLGVPGRGQRTGHMPSYLGDELYREWLTKLVMRNFFGAAAKEQQIGRGGGSNSDYWKDNSEGPVGDALEPSVLFSTITNAHDGMICMNINDSGEQAVAGFRDSCVRVWSLTGRGWQGIRGSADGSSSGSASFEVLSVEGKRAAASAASASASSSTTPSAAAAQGHTREADDGRRTNLPLLEFRGHSAPVYGVSQEQVHSHGRLILSSSSDRTIRLWDTNVGQTVGKYNSAATVWAVAFSPIGYYFAAAAADRSVSVYATDRPTQLRFMASHMSDATCVAWHPNATMLVSGSDDKTVHLWDVRTGSYCRILRGCPSAVSCCSVSPQGDRVAAGTDSGSVHVWDLASGMQLGLLQGHRGPVHSVAFSDAGEALSSGGADYTVRTWDTNQLLGPQGPANEPMPMHSTVPIHSPAQTFHTKFTPVFHVTYTPRNLVLAGGPYALSSAGLARSALLHDQRSEEEVISALGLSYAQKH